MPFWLKLDVINDQALSAYSPNLTTGLAFGAYTNPKSIWNLARFGNTDRYRFINGNIAIAVDTSPIDPKLAIQTPVVADSSPDVDAQLWFLQAAPQSAGDPTYQLLIPHMDMRFATARESWPPTKLSV